MHKFLKQLLPVRNTCLQDLFRTLGILFAATLVGFLVDSALAEAYNASEVYFLAVMLISLTTKGYFWGMLAAAAGVTCSNFFFTYPYFALNFTLPHYPVTFASMFLVALITGTIAAGMKEQMRFSRLREERTKQLNAIAKELLTAQSAIEIGNTAVWWCSELIGGTAHFYQIPPPPEVEGEEAEAVRCCFQTSSERLVTDSQAGVPLRLLPLHSGGRLLGVLCVQNGQTGEAYAENEDFLRLALSQFTLALESRRFADESQRIAIEEQQERMRGNLLRAISHDLRTPLTGILGASSAILENGARIDAQSQTRLVADIREDAQWLLRMVENVLSVTRIGENGPALKKVPEPVEEVAAQAAARCKKRFPSVPLQVKVPQELLMVPMDVTLVEQVLLNLIENAMEYGGGTPVEVTVSKDMEWALIEVLDHGPGVPPKAKSRLFEGFSSRDQKPSDSARGLGLGLSICKSIIAAHGGIIWEDDAPDGGACFKFTLPLESEERLWDADEKQDFNHRG